MDEKRKSSRRMICENLSFASKEAFKRLRTNLVLKLDDNETCHVVGITSAQPTEGKSTIALNLSYSLAELGKNVLLIDADMRRPSIHTKTGIPNQPGLADLLVDSNAIASCIQKYKSSKTSTNFDILPSGNIPSNPSELLNSKRMETLLKTLKTVYDFVILDLPPVGAVIDAVSISSQTEGMVIVLRENNCPAGIFRDCVTQIQETNVPILGFVVNGALEGSGKKSGYSKYGKGYYGSGYYGNYGNYGGYYGPNNTK